MTYVVEEGTGRRGQIDGYLAAGKTGTARKPLPGGGYTDENGRYHYVATFAGFVPADDPQVSIIVVIDEPGTSIYASQVAAPLFSQVATYALRHLRIPPTAEPWVPVVPAPGEGIGGETLTTDAVGRDRAEVPTGAVADDPVTADDVAPGPRDTG